MCIDDSSGTAADKEETDSGMVELNTYKFTGQMLAAAAERESRMISRQDFSSIPCERLQQEAISLESLPEVDGSLENLAVGGLTVSGEIRGALILGDRVPEFSVDDLDLLERISRLISAAIFTRHRMGIEARARAVAEARLAESRKELERMTRINSVGEMTAGIAHELNQPLTALINFTDAACELLSSELPEYSGSHGESLIEVKRLTRRANEEATRAADVLKSVRALVRSESVSFETIVLRELVEESCSLLETEIQEDKAIVDYSDVDPSILLDADRTQFEQLLTNLIRNALQANKDCQSREVKIAAYSNPSSVTLTITDSGKGFLESESEKLFDAFYTTRTAGLGLGLKICRSIVELHGGQINASSSNSKGATFTITFPATKTAKRES